MRNRFLTLTTALFFLVHAVTLNAQEGSTLRLSLSEAQRYALEHNYTMQNASLEVQKAEYTRWQTLASMLPQIKAGFDYQNMCGYTMNFGGGGSMMSMIPDSITIGTMTVPISIPESSTETSTESGGIVMNPSGTFSITASLSP